MKNKMNTEELIEPSFNVEELACAMKVRPDWVYQRIHRDELPFPYFRFGHFLRFPVSGVKKYIESQMKEGKGQ